MNKKTKFICKPMSMAMGRFLLRGEVFDEEFTPELLIGRDTQVEQFRLCLRPLLQNQSPLHALVYGRPGTGKTLMAKILLQELADKTTTQVAYVNCWETPTLYAVTDHLVKHLRIFFAERTDTVYKLERVRQHLTKTRSHLLVVLDEIDKVAPRNLNDTLYNLVQIPSVSLVCISNSRGYLVNLDERILSRFNPVHVECAPYTADELHRILEHRASLGLVTGSCDREVLAAVAQLSEGDARIALKTLKKAAQLAELVPASRIEKDAVVKAFEEVSKVKRKYLLDKLTDHHRHIYSIIEQFPGVNSIKLRQTYLEECEIEGKQPLATRTFRTYVGRLVHAKLIKPQPELGGTGARVFHVIQ